MIWISEPLFTYYTNVMKALVPSEYADLVSVDPPKDQSFGDFSTNITMLVAKKMGRSPMEMSREICEQINASDNLRDLFGELSVKAPGFINWRIPKKLLVGYLRNILDKDFGRLHLGCGKSVNIEYVSANPTGPLHAGHTRGAVSGDVLANLLSFVGYDVVKEYYVNDAGRQIETLARSLHFRYLELFGKADENLPTWAYPGDYLIATAKKIATAHGNDFVDQEESEWLDFFREFAVADMMECIKSDMHALGVYHDIFTSELELLGNGAVESAIAHLKGKKQIYVGVLDVPKGKEPEDWQEREQLLFRSTNFGDDVDRPLQKADGTWTYFATDIAYHLDKINRNFDEMIVFWGADHGGYVKRMQAAVAAISDGKKRLEVKISQIVRFVQNGQELKMSKRAGTFVILRDVLERVGKDVIRFIMLTRLDNAPLDFDFQKVVEQSKDNPVFYVQYAYARTHSVLRQFHQVFGPQKISLTEKFPNFELLDSASEFQLIKVLADWPRQVLMAANNREPHRIAFYMQEVAAKLHSLWNQGKDNALLRFILADDFEKTYARMILLLATQNVLESAFHIMGITPVEELR